MGIAESTSLPAEFLEPTPRIYLNGNFFKDILTVQEPRDIDAERAFLDSINHLDYVLFQRDWDSLHHGDLDLAITAKHWSELISILANFSQQYNFPIVKVYEIERAVVCVILLSDKGWLHLDIAITPHILELFSVDIAQAIKTKETINRVHVITETHAEMYAAAKKRYKHSSSRKLVRKLGNMPVISRRIADHLLHVRGAWLYVPYIVDENILRSTAVQEHAAAYLNSTMRNRYR
jgi:hypothetical protein